MKSNGRGYLAKAGRDIVKEKRCDMEHRVKVTVLDKKLFPELQAQYCANPNSGKCACYHVGDEFMFYRNDERDDYWHMGAGTLVKSGQMKACCFPLERCIAEAKAFRSVQKHGTPSADIFIPHCRAERSCMDGQMMIKS